MFIEKKHSITKTMRKRFLTVTCILFFTNLTYGQMRFARIASMNGQEICCGYDNANNFVHVCVTQDPPFGVPDGYTKVYTWYAEHSNGTKVWNTSSSERRIPMPWPGIYEIQVRIDYVKIAGGGARLAFFSNRIAVKGVECHEEEEG